MVQRGVDLVRVPEEKEEETDMEKEIGKVQSQPGDGPGS